MSAAGNRGKLVEKYKNQGLRVIAVSSDLSNDYDEKFIAKWKAAGAKGKYLSYTPDNIVFKPFFNNIKGFPTNILIKEWKDSRMAFPPEYEAELKKAFGFK